MTDHLDGLCGTDAAALLARMRAGWTLTCRLHGEASIDGRRVGIGTPMAWSHYRIESGEHEWRDGIRFPVREPVTHAAARELISRRLVYAVGLADGWVSYEIC